MCGTGAKKGRKGDQTRRPASGDRPSNAGRSRFSLERLFRCSVDTCRQKTRREGQPLNASLPALLVLGVRSSVGVTVNPLRDPLFYLMFATLFAVAFAATYLALA
jgi:hypothetical protein